MKKQLYARRDRPAADCFEGHSRRRACSHAIWGHASEQYNVMVFHNYPQHFRRERVRGYLSAGSSLPFRRKQGFKNPFCDDGDLVASRRDQEASGISLPDHLR